MISTNILSIVLYGLLGGILSACDIHAMEKPLEFFGIMFIVLAIDLNAGYCMRRMLCD